MRYRRPPDMIDLNEAVGARIRAARQEAGLSMRGLARKCSVSLGCIQHIERGENRAPESTLASIAAAVGKPVDYFFVAHPAPAAVKPRVPTWQQKRYDEQRATHPRQHQVRALPDDAEVVIDRAARAAAAKRLGMTGQIMGDPPPGFSALDRKR